MYANTGDYSPALVMWFFDSRSFVSGTGDGPGRDWFPCLIDDQGSVSNKNLRSDPCGCELLLG